MNKFINFILILLILVGETKVSAEESAVKILSRNFKKVNVSNGDLSITMNDFGRRYLFNPDGKDDDLNTRVLKYGETVILNRGFKKAALFDRQLSLTISKLEKIENGYEMDILMDQRSMGGELIEIKTNFSIKVDSIEDLIVSPQKNTTPTTPSVHKHSDEDSPATSVDSPKTSGNTVPDVKPPLTPPSGEKTLSLSRSLIIILITAGIAILYFLLRSLKKRP